MKRIFDFLKTIPVDKLLHFIAGSLIAQLISAIYTAIFHPSYGGAIAGFVAALIAGIAKELYDEFNKETQTPEFMDFISCALGGLVSAIISLIYIL